MPLTPVTVRLRDRVEVSHIFIYTVTVVFSLCESIHCTWSEAKITI